MRTLSLLMALMLFSLPLLTLAQDTTDAAQAIADARRDAGTDAYTAIQDARLHARADTGRIWYCGGIALLSTALRTGHIQPTPPIRRFLGKSYEYIRIYNREYEKAAQNARLRKSIIGAFVGPILLGGCLTVIINTAD